MNSNTKVAFIGAGNMCRAIVNGLVNKGFDAASIIVANPSPEKRVALANEFGVQETADNIVAAKFADVIILCVKPHLICTVAAQLREQIDINNKCFISVAAGCTVSQMEQALGDHVAIIRAMPNTPAQLGLGVTGLYANASVTSEQKATADQLMQAIGIVTWLEQEAKIDDIISVSGSGPAYFFLFMEAMEKQAIAQGFSPEQSRQLVQQTALGAAKMVVENDLPISQLRANVTSKGGTTNAAVNSFINGGIDKLVADAMKAAWQRAQEMAQENNA
jgi:pyrroline-5-carboxylate reductase